MGREYSIRSSTGGTGRNNDIGSGDFADFAEVSSSNSRAQLVNAARDYIPLAYTGGDYNFATMEAFIPSGST